MACWLNWVFLTADGSRFPGARREPVILLIEGPKTHAKGQPVLDTDGINAAAGKPDRILITIISAANYYLTEAARSSWSGFRESGPLPTRVVLISTTERDGTGPGEVSVVGSGSSSPFGPPEFEMEDRFAVVKTDGKWLVDQAPYQLLSCTGSTVKR